VAVALALALPTALFLVEVVSAVVLRNRDSIVSNAGLRQRVGVLVPAHNESVGLLPTLADVKAQMQPGDRLVVVADNCSDDTALIAREAGAEVVERNDPERKGKGYALARGLDYFSAHEPDVLIVIDADCRLAACTIDQLAAVCAMTRRPVQALDLMIAPAESTINLKVAEFAWRIKNWVRPLGLRALGLPCQLMGTGMAFRWDLIASVNLAHGSLVEDLRLGHELAVVGCAPVFCPSAQVTSVFPSSAAGQQTQRLRWERGHISLMLRTAPRLVYRAITCRNWSLLALALDLSVPPLFFLAMLVVTMLGISGLAAVVGLSAMAFVISAISTTALAAGIFISWWKFGRDVLPRGGIWSLACYACGKLPLYFRIFSGRPAPEWIRTERRGR